MDPSLVVFAIQSGVRLGARLNDVLVKDTEAAPLFLPVGDLGIDVTVDDAREFFLDNPELSRPGGPYHGLNRSQKVDAYKTLIKINRSLGNPSDDHGEAAEIVANLGAFEQYNKALDPNDPLKEILGTLVEIGVDYFVQNPIGLKEGSLENHIVRGFVAHLDQIDFVTGKKSHIVDSLLLAALKSLEGIPELVSDDPRIQSVVGGVTNGLLESVEGRSVGQRVAAEDFAKRIASSAFLGAADAFASDLNLYFDDDDKSYGIVKATVSEAIEGLGSAGSKLSNSSVRNIINAGLTAVATNSDRFSDDVRVRTLIESTVSALTSKSGGVRSFPSALMGPVLEQALVIAGEHAERLLVTTDPEKHTLGLALQAVARGLSNSVAGSTSIKDMLSVQQLSELAALAMGEVARHPALVVESESDPRKLVLSQVIGSVARALGTEPTSLITGDGFLSLVDVALETVMKNRDRLLDVSSFSPTNNFLYATRDYVMKVSAEHEDKRELLSESVIIDIVGKVLRVASANSEALVGNATPIVRTAASTALDLAEGALAGRINGDNLPKVVEGLLIQLAWDELHPEEAQALQNAATLILRAA
jgi:hypothetical protein